jgi:hypothetical protein
MPGFSRRQGIERAGNGRGSRGESPGNFNRAVEVIPVIRTDGVAAELRCDSRLDHAANNLGVIVSKGPDAGGRMRMTERNAFQGRPRRFVRSTAKDQAARHS